jgi:hypothetical protein
METQIFHHAKNYNFEKKIKSSNRNQKNLQDIWVLILGKI